jgi:hypothetical protein
MPSGMFSVSEAEAAAIRAAYEQRGELAAAVELRRRFPGIDSTAQAREFVRVIAGWKPRSLRELPKRPRLPRVRWREADASARPRPYSRGSRGNSARLTGRKRPRACRR